MRVTFFQTDFWIKQGDITEESIDIIVNAANPSLLGGGGVDGAIHRAAGPSLLQECAQIGGCFTGGAVVTKAGDLSAKYVVHTVGPIWNGGDEGEADLLRSSYQNSLTLAVLKGCTSIAFPSISTGTYKYPIVQAAPIALQTCIHFVQSNQTLKEIRFILHSESDQAVYESALAKFDK